MAQHNLNRRQFLTAAASGAVGVPLMARSTGKSAAAPSTSPTTATGNPIAGEPIAQAPHPMSVDGKASIVLESPRRTPIAADVDVLVAGGGPTGVGAALAAAREGARTLIIERHGMLGGMWTAGLLNPFFDFQGKGWIVADLVRRLTEANAWHDWKSMRTFDVEAMKLLLEASMAEARADTWYQSFAADTIVERDRVRGVIVESKSGREAVLAKVVIDCTGDGDVAVKAGVPYRVGRLTDSACQPMTLMFEVDGVGDYLQKDAATLYDAMSDAIHENGLDITLPFERVNYAPFVINLPAHGTAAVQATHVYRMNPLDTRDLTRATIAARRQAHDLVQVMQRIPALQKMRLTQTASSIGIRETRHLEGRYTLNLDHLRAGRTFEDAVTFGAFGVDIHEVNPGEKEKSAHSTPIRPYEIPYRCLLPRAVRGLIFAGRCISGTHEAHASYRVTGTCMAMGQAAGLAAAMAAAENVPADQLDGRLLRRALRDRGVGFVAD